MRQTARDVAARALDLPEEERLALAANTDLLQEAPHRHLAEVQVLGAPAAAEPRLDRQHDFSVADALNDAPAEPAIEHADAHTIRRVDSLTIERLGSRSEINTAMTAMDTSTSTSVNPRRAA